MGAPHSPRVSVTCPRCGTTREVIPSMAGYPYCNKICRSFWSPHVEEALALRHNGLTWRAIAVKFGRRPEEGPNACMSVIRWAKRRGIPTPDIVPHPRGRWPQEYDALLSLRLSGVGVAELGARYGMTKRQMQRVLYHLGIAAIVRGAQNGASVVRRP